MTWKDVGWVATGIVAGFIGAKLVRGASQPEVGSTATLVAPVQIASTTAPDTAPPGIDPRIAKLKNEIEALKAADFERIRMHSRQRVDQMISQQKQDASDSLVAAGFSAERAQWLMSRADELLAKRKRAQEEATGGGPPVDQKVQLDVIEASADKDILLLPEVSEAEFERYRVASGRPIGVEVASVPAGSNAERAGIKPGDVILSYGGKRVINIVPLNMFSMQSPPVGSVQVEVRRDGKTLRLPVPSGPIYVKARRSPPN